MPTCSKLHRCLHEKVRTGSLVLRYGRTPRQRCDVKGDECGDTTSDGSRDVPVLRGKQAGWCFVSDEKTHEGKQQVHEGLRPGKIQRVHRVPQQERPVHEHLSRTSSVLGI